VFFRVFVAFLLAVFFVFLLSFLVEIYDRRTELKVNSVDEKFYLFLPAKQKYGSLNNGFELGGSRLLTAV